MASTTVYIEILSRLLGIPAPTIVTYIQRLRQDETLFRRGKQGHGAIEPSISEIANLIIALCATPSSARKGPDTLDVVRTARAAKRLGGLHSPSIGEDIAHFAFARAETFGEALDALLSDMIDGKYTEWKGDDYPFAWIRFFDHGGRILVNLQRSPAHPKSHVMFRNDDGDFGGPCLNQIAELDLFALDEVAHAMRPIVREPAT